VLDSVYGQHDAHWIGFYAYFREVLGITKQTDDLRGLRTVCEHAGWWLPHQNICWVSERHDVLHQDVQHRLHCEGGPALRYPDGWSIYRWHGVEIPAWIVERPQDITPAKISAEKNAEVRRVMTLKYGLARYLQDSDAREIDRDRDLHGERVLYEVRDPLGMMRVILLENSTPEVDGSRKPYTFRVPPTTQSCAQAVAWIYSLPTEKYRPVMES
jgi:hypothetical protein